MLLFLISIPIAIGFALTRLAMGRRGQPLNDGAPPLPQAYLLWPRGDYGWRINIFQGVYLNDQASMRGNASWAGTQAGAAGVRGSPLV